MGITTCTHGHGLGLKPFVWIGVTHNKWPLVAFESAAQAAGWVAENPAERHVYKVDATPLAEIMHIPPVPATHREVEL